MRDVRFAAWAALVPLLLALGACSTSKGTRSAGADDTTIGSPAGTTGGGYYLDDGPGHLSAAEVASVPDAVPRAEPVLARTSRPYTVFGRTYTPMNSIAPYRERGVASWYGRRYHGKPTSSGEPYDMYAMTAAHPTLAIPSYVRVTSVGTGRSVVVRVNDRGPFLQNRVIDLSYTAAAKLGFVEAGSAEVVVEAITDFDAPGAAPVLVADGGAGAVAGASTAVAAGASGAGVAESAPERLIVETSFSGGSNPASASPAVHTEAGARSPILSVGSSLPSADRMTKASVDRPGGATPGSQAGMTVGSIPAAASTSTPAVSPAPGTAVPATNGELPGFWLQFGAFASADGARTVLERLQRELAWLGARFDVRREGRLYKVQAGSWPQRSHALDAAARIRSVTAFEPFAVFRR